MEGVINQKTMLKQMKFLILKNIFTSLSVLVSTTAPSGLTAAKTIAMLKISMVISFIPLTIFTNIGAGLFEWGHLNALYINLVMFSILGDWLLGTIKHIFWIRDFSWKQNIKGIIVKTLLTLIVGGVFEGLKYLTIEYTIITTYIISVLRLTVFLYPAMSIIRSSRVISDGKFPPQGIYDAIENWASKIGNKDNNLK